MDRDFGGKVQNMITRISLNTQIHQSFNDLGHDDFVVRPKQG